MFASFLIKKNELGKLMKVTVKLHTAFPRGTDNLKKENREGSKPEETLNSRKQVEGCWRGGGWADGVTK